MMILDTTASLTASSPLDMWIDSFAESIQLTPPWITSNAISV